jgi:non-specific serine/threonine protein kinase
MLRRIDRDPTLLAGASPDLEERQRTIERSIWWSLDLLTGEERADAHLLGLAPAGWSEATLAAVEPAVSLTTLEHLLNLGLLSRVGDRLTMLQTVRDVVAGSQAVATRDRNRERWVDAVIRDADRVQGLGAGPAGLAEDANLRAVVSLLADQGDADRLLAFVVSTDAYWLQAGTAGAIAGRIRWALERTSLPEVSRQLRALQLGSVSSTLVGETDGGLALAHRMVALGEERGTAHEHVRALNVLGGAYLMAHQPELAYDTFRAALPFEDQGVDVTKIYINLAGVAVALERDDEAVELLETVRARAAETTGIDGHPVPLMHLSELAIRAGDLATARRHLLESLGRSVEINQRVWQLGAAFLTGGLAQACGDLDAAAAIVARTEAFLDRERMDLGVLVDAAGMARLDELRAQIGPERWRELRRAGADAGLPGLVAEALAWLSRPAATELETEAGPLTTREREIARLIAAGRSNQEIADQLFLSRRTVQTHVANMLRKLDLPSRSALAAWQASSASPRT